LSRCPFVPGQGQEQKSQDKLFCPVTSRVKITFSKKQGKSYSKKGKGRSKTEKGRSKTEKGHSKTGKRYSKTGKDVVKQERMRRISFGRDKVI
jgi:hypothetical protein